MLLKHRRFALSAFFFVVLMLTAFAPTVEAAELYDSGDPTPAAQLVLEYINRARSDPLAEGRRLGIDIHEGLPNPSLVDSRPPLAMNKRLLGIAQAHSQEMYNLNYYSHNDPNGTTPFKRMTHAGYDYLRAGENMAAASTVLSATELEDFMMVDAGTTGRPHRVNLLDLITPYPCGDPPCVYSEVGIGYYAKATPNGIGLSSLITEDFGADPSTTSFLLGVVYNDRNNNKFYDIGEGIAGVTIRPSSGTYYAVSSTSGGYAIPTSASGTITVTASGFGFATITRGVTLTGTNMKLDFTQTGMTSSYSASTDLFHSTMSSSTSSISLIKSVTTSTATAISQSFTSSTTTVIQNTKSSTTNLTAVPEFHIVPILLMTMFGMTLLLCYRRRNMNRR
jgi:hypothetical protein